MINQDNLFQGRKKFFKYKRILLFISSFVKLFPFQLKDSFLVLSRGFPSVFGIAVRYIFLRSLAKECGDNVAIFPSAFLSYVGSLSIGNNVSIRELCHLGCEGELVIEDNVSIGHASSVLTTEHNYFQSDLPMRNAPIIKKKTLIKEGAWIGCHVTILAGVTIGKEAVVGAGAVVTKSVPDYAIVVGVPAQVKGYRQQINELESSLSNSLS